MPDLSIIIVNYKGWKRLKQCLDSLKTITLNIFTFEVIIIDNFSNDGIVEKYKAYYPSFRFIENSGNNGFANGCNLGASLAKGKILLFLNPDTIVSKESMSGMVQELQSRKDSCIISCRQLRENGSEEKAFGRFLTFSTLTGWLRALRKLIRGKDRIKFAQDSRHVYPDWVSGSVIMIRKENFENIGGWDEDFWMYFEDVDLCRRFRNSGGKIIFLKDIALEHNHGGATRINSFVTAMTKTEVIISKHVYISKHLKRYQGLTQTFLVFNNTVSLFFPAVLGLIFFFNKKMSTYCRIFTNLMDYYFNSLFHGTWLSVRSVNYKRVIEKKNSNLLGG